MPEHVSAESGPADMKRITILTVHGVGEQRRFEYLEAIASNLYAALNKHPGCSPSVQMRYGDQAQRHGEADTWREVPVEIQWKTAQGEWIHARFREVFWADLDTERTWGRWLKFVGWALGMSGVHLYNRSPTRDGPEFVRPRALTRRQRLIVRSELFLTSIVFAVMLFTLDLTHWVLKRLSLRLEPIEHVRNVIYNYVGDVKLYQDWFERWGQGLEGIGEKSRVAIRRRMVRTWLRTVAEVESGEIDGYYIFAHSLGTVVAFNGLMESALTLPNYLTDQEWRDLPPALKRTAPHPAPARQSPHRPPWLSAHDAIDRSRLFAGLRGFLTIGSPLDKFATLWPAIVPINVEPNPATVPWINVADQQDFVAGSLDLFSPVDSNTSIGGLHLTNVEWADQPWPITAHTSYWTVKRNQERLMDHVIGWLEGGAFERPTNNLNPRLARVIFWVFPFLMGTIAMATAAYALRFLVEGGATHHAAPLTEWVSAVLSGVLVTVGVSSIVRALRERLKFGWR